MILEPLHRHLKICARQDVDHILRGDPGFWNVISIRDRNARELHFPDQQSRLTFRFDDVEDPIDSTSISPEVANGLWTAIERDDSSPLLVHCSYGISRSTAVVAALTLARLAIDHISSYQMVEAAVENLLTLRPMAYPNTLVMTRMLEQRLPVETAGQLSNAVRNHPRIVANRIHRVDL